MSLLGSAPLVSLPPYCFANSTSCTMRACESPSETRSDLKRLVQTPIAFRAWRRIIRSGRLLSGQVRPKLEDGFHEPGNYVVCQVGCHIRRWRRGGYNGVRAVRCAFGWWSRWRERWTLRLSSVCQGNAEQGNHENGDRDQSSKFFHRVFRPFH
jgi:hypothetical protein